MTWFSGLLGKDGASKAGVDPKHFALRVSGRPMELGARGAYALGVRSTVMAAGLAADAEIFQMRWVDATRVCLIRSVIICAYRNTTAFATGVARFQLRFARGWSADGGAGAPVVFSTANTNKKRTDFALSLFSDTGVRFSQTAALTAGTKTLDTNPLSGLGAFVSTGATSVPDSWIIQPGTYLWQRNTHEEYPLLLEQNDGIVVQATVPATGTWDYNINVEWAELDPVLVDGWL